MKKLLHKFCKKQIAMLMKERKQIKLALEWWPAGSFGAARLTLALAIVEVKIELWRAIIEIVKC